MNPDKQKPGDRLHFSRRLRKMAVRPRIFSQKLAELVRRKAGIPDNTAHGEPVHGVVPWDGHDAPAVGHDDVLALPRDLETGLLKRPHSP
jgi:hypothetical protein